MERFGVVVVQFLGKAKNSVLGEQACLEATSGAHPNLRRKINNTEGC